MSSIDIYLFQNLFEFCGYKDAQVSLDGLSLDTFGHMQSLIRDGVSN